MPLFRGCGRMRPVVRHDITGAAALAAAFVLMALTMVLTRTAVTAVWAWRTHHAPAGKEAAAALSAEPLAAEQTDAGEPACA
jgi:hypothetical protein